MFFCGIVIHFFFYLFQIAGALAEEGCSLDQIVFKVTEVLKEIGQSQGNVGEAKGFFTDRVHTFCAHVAGTLGVSLSPCSVPGCLPTFDLPPGHMELGLGEKSWGMGIKKKKVLTKNAFKHTMLKVLLSTAPTVIQGSLGITSLPLNKTRSDKTFSLFSGIHGEPGIKTSKVGKTSQYLCFIYLSYEDCCAFFFPGCFCRWRGEDDDWPHD